MIEQSESEYQAVNELILTLKELRLEAGLSQRAVASTMGMSQPNYQRLETATYQPTISTFQAWARSLGYQVELNLVKDEDAMLDSLDRLLGLA